ncbi:hypothetical protein NHX12_000675 [Muraenolepis orangiensis]|uniref:Uncharacterized protein n=1 Tax=Muraenolepis orangiensis TaxID=630683 RepID=A0A9Q0E165_9TELE|nr:hypothetical protein NHX12_000675 [Muraenolepis orangiensis]
MKPSRGPWWWSLLCLSVALRSGSHAVPIRKGETAAAMKAEVDVVAFGVIQLIDTLGQVNQTLEARMEAVGRSLAAHDRRLRLLGEEAGRAAEAQRHAKEALRQLQVQMARVQAQGRGTRDRLARVQQEDQELWTRVARVERYLDPTLPAHIKQLKEKATEHSNILRMLQLFTKYQRESLQDQNRQLSELSD